MTERCKQDGSLMDGIRCSTMDVLDEIATERHRQFVRHGDNLVQLSGTGPRVPWAEPIYGVAHCGASVLEQMFRVAYEATGARGQHVSWLQIALEEFSEVAQEDDPAKLQEELIQLAAVCVSWVEKLRDPESLARADLPVATLS